MTRALDHIRNLIHAKADEKHGRANMEKISGECEALYKTDPKAAEDKIRNLPPDELFALANQNADSNSSPEKQAVAKLAREYFAKQYGDALSTQPGGDKLKASADKLASGGHLSKDEWADLEVASHHLTFKPPVADPAAAAPASDQTV